MSSKGMTPKNQKVRWNIGGMPLFCYLNRKDDVNGYYKRSFKAT